MVSSVNCEHIQNLIRNRMGYFSSFAALFGPLAPPWFPVPLDLQFPPPQQRHRRQSHIHPPPPRCRSFIMRVGSCGRDKNNLPLTLQHTTVGGRGRKQGRAGPIPTHENRESIDLQIHFHFSGNCEKESILINEEPVPK